ncbi:MAG: Delta-aminolevulinic acid dehydratase [Candidatus Heimdallarchaeota archaeon LC_3]|nr:MAG: Delta-aminolevulinic acid dehydratase [Candidatus Heimdallarchaeota archaeon LC_3]
MKLTKRPRRLRNSAILREATSEVNLNKEKLIMPIFLTTGEKIKKEISAMPGIFHYSIDEAIKQIQNYIQLGINKILLFGNPDQKDQEGIGATLKDGIIPEAIQKIKNEFGNTIYVIADVCLCPYTTHGHCGVPNESGIISNDESVETISEAALTYATAGCDMVAPSDMMDGRIQAIREKLDEHGFQNIPILSYSVKFASSYYGPFREAVDSSPKFGDRKTYQLSPNNARLALREVTLDEEEGADLIMIKPALAYLDIILQVRQLTKLPIVAYNVSGEYSMVKIAGKAGLIDEKLVAMENLTAILRAGADLIISYHTIDLVESGVLK